MLLSKLLAPLGLSCGEDLDITDIVYDSRKAGPGCLFVCIPGSAADGHGYAAAAASAGATPGRASTPARAKAIRDLKSSNMAHFLSVPPSGTPLLLLPGDLFRQVVEIHPALHFFFQGGLQSGLLLL